MVHRGDAENAEKRRDQKEVRAYPLPPSSLRSPRLCGYLSPLTGRERCIHPNYYPT